MIRVCIADDQTLVRQGIRSLLELADGIEVVAEARDGVEALDAVAREQIDVLLLDLRMPRLDGLGVLRALSTRDSSLNPPTIPPPRPRLPVLVLTTFDDDELVLGALRAGARGYLLKDVTLAELRSAIHTLHNGGNLIQPTITAALVRNLTQHPPNFESIEAPPALTPRELDVLRLVATGYSNREVAELLVLTEGTVKNHVSAILTKLGVRDRTRAVLRAIDLGLIGGAG